MSDKRYTAQEMRGMAANIGPSPNMPDREDNIRAEVESMLRYAAGVVERANERRGTFAANYGRIDYESDSAIVDEIDYILRGEEGKEEK